MDYFGKRQNPLNVSDEERDNAFRAIHEHFQTDWLTAQGDHVVQRVWRRRDALSAFELYSLGNSLARLGDIDNAWVKHQVKIVKGPDENNTNGALFELLGASYMLNGDQKVMPARQNQRGYDADVQGGDGHAWRVSMKTYSPSTHERLFQRRMRSAREKVRALLPRHIRSVQTIVLATTCPTEADWQVLWTTIAEAASKCGGTPIILERGCWVLTLSSMSPLDGQTLSPYHVSDHIIGTAPFHQNEHRNLVSKLEDAASNMAKHVVDPNRTTPLLLIRLPPTASAYRLKAWADQYFADNPKSVLKGVILLQPYLFMDDASKQTNITFFSQMSRPRSSLVPIRPPRFEVPHGTTTSAPPTWAIGLDQQPTVIRDAYVFQQGDQYELMRKTSTGYEGELTRTFPGVCVHSVLDDTVGRITLAGRWGDELELIGH